MGKKLFNELIRRASQPVPKAEGTKSRPDANSAKQTRPRKAASTYQKRGGASQK